MSPSRAAGFDGQPAFNAPCRKVTISPLAMLLPFPGDGLPSGTAIVTDALVCGSAVQLVVTESLTRPACAPGGAGAPGSVARPLWTRAERHTGRGARPWQLRTSPASVLPLRGAAGACRARPSRRTRAGYFDAPAALPVGAHSHPAAAGAELPPCPWGRRSRRGRVRRRQRRGGQEPRRAGDRFLHGKVRHLGVRSQDTARFGAVGAATRIAVGEPVAGWHHYAASRSLCGVLTRWPRRRPRTWRSGTSPQGPPPHPSWCCTPTPRTRSAISTWTPGWVRQCGSTAWSSRPPTAHRVRKGSPRRSDALNGHQVDPRPLSRGSTDASLFTISEHHGLPATGRLRRRETATLM